MPENEPKYGNPEVPQPSPEQVDALVRSLYERYAQEGADSTPWLVRASHNDHHPAIWRHFQIKVTDTESWTVQTAQRSINLDGSWFETRTSRFTYENGQLGVKFANLGSLALKDLVLMSPRSNLHYVFDRGSDDTPEEAAQLLYSYLTQHPPISKAEALAAYQESTGAQPGEVIGIDSNVNRRIRTGTFIGRILERTYAGIDPSFARYDEQ